MLKNIIKNLSEKSSFLAALVYRQVYRQDANLLLHPVNLYVSLMKRVYSKYTGSHPFYLTLMVQGLLRSARDEGVAIYRAVYFIVFFIE